MNERIKELEKKCWSHRVDGALVDGQLHFDAEKFAKLIVEKCAAQIQNFVDHRLPASEYSSKLRQYFEVES